MTDIINPYTEKQQLSNGVYVMEDGHQHWGGEVNHNFELLNSALDTKTLTIKQGDETLGTYGGKLDAEITIPASSNQALTIRQGDETLGTYDGSSTTEVSIPVPSNQALTIKQGDETLGTYDGSTATEVVIPAASGSADPTEYTVTANVPIIALSNDIITGLGYTLEECEILAIRTGCLKYLGTKTFTYNGSEVEAPCFALTKFLTSEAYVLIPYAHRLFTMALTGFKHSSSGWAVGIPFSLYYTSDNVFHYSGTNYVRYPDAWQLSEIEEDGTIPDAFGIVCTAEPNTSVEIEGNPVTITETIKIGDNSIGLFGVFDICEN